MSSTVTRVVAEGDVYLGVWTNWRRGAVAGLTITLTRRSGGLLTTFLALFIGLTGTCFWRLSCFALHRLLSSGPSKFQDGVYHQRQAILRNAATGSNGILGLLRVLWTWWRHSQGSLKRIAPIIGIGIGVVVAFTIAGIFSSRISTVLGNEVLLSGVNCGWLNWTSTTTEQYRSIQLPQEARSWESSSDYARRCYDNTVEKDCPTYVKSFLNKKVTKTDNCPFQKGMCADISLQLDSGEIDSLFELGINSKPQDRFSFRVSTTCSPLITEGYFVDTNSKDERWQRRYMYGGFTAHENFTYGYGAYVNLSEPGLVPSKLDYVVRSMGAPLGYPKTSGGSWLQPIPQLKREDADVSMVFIAANEIGHFEKVEDKLFSAHLMKKFQVNGGLTQSRRSLKQNQPNGRGPGSVGVTCTVLSLNHYEGTQVTLPKDQWQLEVSYWFDTLLAMIQRWPVDAAAGPTDPTLDRWLDRPQSEEELRACRSQVARSDAFTSFSLLGIMIIFIIGGLIILTDSCIKPLVAFIDKRRGRNLYQHLEWDINQTLQLQRLAHERLWNGTWNTFSWAATPATALGDRLRQIYMADSNIPVPPQDVEMERLPVQTQKVDGTPQVEAVRFNILERTTSEVRLQQQDMDLVSPLGFPQSSIFGGVESIRGIPDDSHREELDGEDVSETLGWKKELRLAHTSATCLNRTGAFHSSCFPRADEHSSAPLKQA